MTDTELLETLVVYTQHMWFQTNIVIMCLMGIGVMLGVLIFATAFNVFGGKR